MCINCIDEDKEEDCQDTEILCLTVCCARVRCWRQLAHRAWQARDVVTRHRPLTRHDVRRTRRGAQVDRSGAFTPVGTIKLISLISSALMVILGVTAALALDPNAGGGSVLY